MSLISNLQNWYKLATSQPAQARQALGQTVANVASRITPNVVGAGPVAGISNRVAGTNVTGYYDKPYVQPKPAIMVTGGSSGARASSGGIPQVGPTSNAPASSATTADIARANVGNAYDDYNQIIERDYNDTMNMLNSQEAYASSMYKTGGDKIGNDYTENLGQMQRQQDTAVSGIEGQRQVAETEANTGMRSARDLFRQTQQQNIAQLSGMGISSSSVAEALAETLGVETARRLGQITNSLSDVRVNAAKELGKIATYYEDRRTGLLREKQTALDKLRADFQYKIDQVNSERNRAASAKAQARTDLLYEAKSAAEAINRQVDAYNEALDKWKESQTKALTPFASDDSYIQQFLANKGILEQAYSPTQFDILPSISQNARGQYSSTLSVKPKKDDGTDVSLEDALNRM